MAGIVVYTRTAPTSPANAIIQTLVDTIRRERFTPGAQVTDADAFGILMAEYFDWDSRILEAAAYALEDANFHSQAGEVKAMHDAIVTADDDEPYDDSMRKALFAKLGEVYGKGLSRIERLAKLSILVGRPIHTMSLRTANPVTVGEFRRVMDLLDTLAK